MLYCGHILNDFYSFWNFFHLYGYYRCVQSLLRGDKTAHKYTRLNDEVELSNERYLEDVQSQQQVFSIDYIIQYHV